MTIALFLVFTAPSSPLQPSLELTKLQGHWTMITLDVQEAFVPEAKLKGTTLEIKGNTYTVTVRKTKHEVTLKLDPTQDPKHIDMTFPDGPNQPKLSKGIYKIEGDKLIICRGQAADGERPRNFVSSLTNDHFVVTWERTPDPKK